MQKIKIKNLFYFGLILCYIPYWNQKYTGIDILLKGLGNSWNFFDYNTLMGIGLALVLFLSIGLIIISFLNKTSKLVSILTGTAMLIYLAEAYLIYSTAFLAAYLAGVFSVVIIATPFINKLDTADLGCFLKKGKRGIENGEEG